MYLKKVYNFFYCVIYMTFIINIKTLNFVLIYLKLFLVVSKPQKLVYELVNNLIKCNGFIMIASE